MLVIALMALFNLCTYIQIGAFNGLRYYNIIIVAHNNINMNKPIILVYSIGT